MHKIESLPKWTQKLIEEQKRELDQLKKKCCEIIPCLEKNQDWFVINNPNKFIEFNRDIYTLYALTDNQALSVCSLYKDDKLIVIRCK